MYEKHDDEVSPKERWNYRSNLNVPSLSAVGTHASPIMETTDMSCPFTMKRRIRCFAFWVCFFSFSPFFSFVFTNWYVFGVLCYFSVTHSPFTHICSFSLSLPLPLPLSLSLSLSLSLLLFWINWYSNGGLSYQLWLGWWSTFWR